MTQSEKCFEFSQYCEMLLHYYIIDYIVKFDTYAIHTAIQ
jgi:hypothetical protein